ncbi:amino acid ABC transporter substrate-binding protein [Candidatus Dependentiae bacterium]|nr:amino acid ABC transporter substrate-binding protein [Candidatus Dependentiae bacterium]MCC7415421.1 amino acid ABC transporter substrate-binding protein [Campylobacterota bacterium]
MKKYVSNLFSITLAFVIIYLFWNFVRQPSCPAHMADGQRSKTGTTELSDTIIVGTNAEYQPFSFLRDGTIVGFDIDVAKEVVKRLGKNIEIIDMPFDMLLPCLQMGTVQIIAAGISPKPSRAKHVLFTKPYFENDPLLVITPKKDAPITTLDQLDGKTVVVNDGYTADSYMSERKNVRIQRLATPAQALLALSSGRADAYVAATSSVQRFLATHPDEYNTYTIGDTSDTYALVISPEHAALLQPIQDALDGMLKDGSIDALKKTWGLA